MKKISILRFLLIALFVNMSIAMSAVTIGDFDYKLDVFNNTAEVTSYKGSETEVVIPSSVSYSNKAYIVTSLGGWCFSNAMSITSVTIPSTVTSVGTYCFSSCHSLTKLTIPASVTSIGYRSIMNCPNLEELSVEPGNPIYDSRNNCNAIIETETNTMLSGCQSTVIPETVTSLGDNCFSECFNLNSITIPESVTSLGEFCFGQCGNIKTIVIPNSVTSMGDWCFNQCVSLETVTLSTSLTSLPNSCFANCNSLKSITIPESVTSFGGCCFLLCI